MTFRPTSVQRQQGNTLVGIIIGLVIGLGIAVVVALMITKGQSPFTDRASKSGKASEPAAGQISDPNKPMYGNKDAARDAAKDFAREEPKAPVVRETPAATPAPAPAVAKEAPKAPPQPDALQQVVDRIEAQNTPKTAAKAPAAGAAAAPAAAPAAAGDEKWVYYLQAGAFREAADAENTRAKLALMGFEATVSDRTTDTGVLHRVRMGPFTQVEAMNKVRSKLSENGVDVAVVRNQR
ncbi:SPOR domain-containing protein [Massilia sp. MB5]|uniref:SPOR domain-containing protein n=1 Tax=unclassified Massilia TaxID=2609279 RepID=UPI00067A80E4|nr:MULTISPECIES: SPOR domain-containing protein [unclassified Massilia]AKU22582.1 cell division protein [Massilia sp. NR 4-1]UMR32635.1 SPOR domain-containing protein [Massilia sp. MB5]